MVIAAIRLGQSHLFKQGFQPVIPHAHSLPDKVTAQGTRQVTLPQPAAPVSSRFC